MGTWKGTKQGVGVKGKSGRKSAYEEFNKVRSINKLWEKLRIKIEKNEELTEFEEKLVAPLLAKTIQTQTDITSGGEKVTPIISLKDYEIQGDNSNSESDKPKEED